MGVAGGGRGPATSHTQSLVGLTVGLPIRATVSGGVGVGAAGAGTVALRLCRRVPAAERGSAPRLQEKRNIYDQISAADELRQQQQDLVTRLRTELQAPRRRCPPACRASRASRLAPPWPPLPPAAAQLHARAPLRAQVFSVDEIERKIKVTPSPPPRPLCQAGAIH